MNLKYVLILSVFFMGCVISKSSSKTPAVIGKNKIIMSITSAHTRVFSKENLITERISENDSVVWENLLTEIYKYVKNSASNINLVRGFNKIRAASEDLLYTLRLTYGVYILPAITDISKRQEGLNIKAPQAASKIDKSKINIDDILVKISSLKDQENSMKAVQNKLLTYKVSSPDVVDVLERLAFTVEVTISKVFKDAQKVKDFVAGESIVKLATPSLSPN